MALSRAAEAAQSSPATTDRWARGFCFATAAVFALATWAVLGGPAWMVAAWPWPETGMSFVFLSSIAASIAMVWLVTGWLGEFGTLVSIAVNILVSAGGVSAFLAMLLLRGAQGVVSGLAMTLAITLFGAGLLLWARRQPVRDRRPVPGLVRAAFLVFVIVLVGAGALLALQIQVFPWRVQPQTATIFGWIFLGAAAYFAHSFARGERAFIAPPLAGFLAYDAVLYVPYVRMLLGGDSGGAEVNKLSLAGYLVVLTSSAILAVYVLLISPETRLVGARAAPGRAQ